MPSSTSSSDTSSSERSGGAAAQVAADAVRAGSALMQPGKPGDDPGIGHGPVERPLPQLRLGVAGIVALLVFALGMLAWELYWRDYGAEPGFRNSEGQWALQRRRIDEGEGDATVLLGDSRILFDVDLDTWERLAGERPIQLALEGTSPMFALEDLAADPDFTGRLLVGLAPDVFFSGYAMRGDVLEYYRDETPAQRAGEWLSMQVLEPRLAFMDPDFALFTVLARQPWPARAGKSRYTDVRKLSMSDADRNTRMWRKVEEDAEYRELARSVWAQFLPPPPAPGTPAPQEPSEEAKEFMRSIEEQIGRAEKAVATLRARGVPVVFVRPPSSDTYFAFEQAYIPRETTWDVLLQRTGAPGIHFLDHPDMQGLELPEWSHLSAADAKRYTAALHRAYSEITATNRVGDP